MENSIIIKNYNYKKLLSKFKRNDRGNIIIEAVFINLNISGNVMWCSRKGINVSSLTVNTAGCFYSEVLRAVLLKDPSKRDKSSGDSTSETPPPPPKTLLFFFF